jgi:hypothetical protein
LSDTHEVPASKPARPRESAAAKPAATAPPASAEHILMSSDEPSADPRKAGRTVRERVELRNALRHTSTEVTLFEEGFARVVERSRGTLGDAFLLDLHYLDPIPEITKVIAKRALLAALGCVLAAFLALLLAQVSVLAPAAVPAALLAAVAAPIAAAAALYRSYERIEFCTLHGRASVLSLAANFGAIRRFRAFVPMLSRAIEESAETITADTSAYLRAEMREHYRLRGDGVLTEEACAEGTGRILAQFEFQI